MPISLRSSGLLAFVFFGLSAAAQFGAARTVHPFGGSAKMQSADIDADGDLDLFGVFDQHHLKWFENTDGAGDLSNAQAITSISGECHASLLADVDGDLDPDIVLVSTEEDHVEVLFNDGSGNFATPGMSLPTPGAPEALAAADINGDGFQDLLVTLWFPGGAGFGWFPGTASGFDDLVELPEIHEGSPSSLLAVADLDLVGGLDVVLRAENDVLILARNTAGIGTAWEVDTLPIPDGPPSYPYRAPQLIDVDGDGDLDLAESRGPAVHWLRNGLEEGGILSFEELVIEPWTTSGNGVFGKSPCGIGASVVFVPANPALAVKWNSFVPLLNGFPFSNDLPGLPRGQDVILADLDGDGGDDLVISTDSDVSWYPNTLAASTTTLELPLLDTLCMAGGPVPLPDGIPVGGRWYGYQISNDLLFRANIGTTVDLPVTHVAYEDQGCALAAQTSIRLIERPTILTTVPDVLCSADEPIQLEARPISSVWYGMDGSSILDPALFNGGYVRCEYTDASGTVCANVRGPIERWNTLPAAIAPAGPFCSGDPVQTLLPSAAPPFNVSWSGDISGSTLTEAYFDPSQGPGTYEVIMTVVPFAQNQCGNSDTIQVVVGEQPVISFAPIPVHCADGLPIELSGALPEGGVWSGDGVSDGQLDPVAVGPGVHLLSYFASSPEGCATQSATSIELASVATVGWDTEDLLICNSDATVRFSASPAGGVWDTPIATDGLLEPSGMPTGPFIVHYTYTDPRGCVLENEPIVGNVGAVTNVTIDPVATLCTTAQPVDLIGSVPGIWGGAVSGDGATTVFDPSLLGQGTWTVTLTSALPDECPGTASQEIVVDICAGVQENNAITPTLAPNPFSERTVLQFNATGQVRVDVLDAIGRLVRTNTVAGSGPVRVGIDLAGEPVGLYVVRIAHGDQTFNICAVKAD